MAEKAESKPDLSKLSDENVKNFKNEDEKLDAKKWVWKSDVKEHPEKIKVYFI